MWCPVCETFHWSPVQLLFQRLDEMPRVSSKVTPFGNISPNDFVGILNRTFLPRMIRMAEKDTDAKNHRQVLVLLKQNVVVRRHGSHLGEPFFDTQKCPMDLRNGGRSD